MDRILAPRTRCVVGVAALPLLALAACGGRSTTSSSDPGYQFSIVSDEAIDYESIAIGSFHYHTNWCRKCHFSSGVSGERARGPSLIDDEWLHCDGSIEGLMEVIRRGVPDNEIQSETYTEMMPPASMMNFDEDHIRAIATYIWVLNQAPRQESVEP